MPCVPGDAGGGLLREGRDFRSTAELVAKLPERPSEWLRPGLGEELAAATLRELMWLELGGAPRRDEQAAWRVELWEEFLVEQQRAMLAASSFEGL